MYSTLNGAENDLSYLLPVKTGSWEAQNPDHYYNNETLYDYIDGGAELYISYNFINVVSRRYIRDNHPDLVIELFDMKESRNALGLFSNMREKNQNEFGQGSQYIEGSLIFWKDRYFVAISCITINNEIKEAIYDLAGKVDKMIPSRGSIPKIIGLLPQNGLVNEGYCVFHHYIWTNAYYFISNDNLFQITDSTNAVLAKYGDAKQRTYLLIVEYPGVEDAKKAYINFTTAFSKGTGPQKLEDKTWHMASIKGKYIISAFNGTGKKQILQFISEVEQQISNL
jgi:hypothetical protein